jgi:hypothetical protein
MRDKVNKKKRRNAKKKAQRSATAEEAEVEESTVLDYGDYESTTKQESDSSAAIESQLMQDVQVAAKVDLPPLPEDVESLPVLAPAHIRVGTILAFKMWAINAHTVTPEISKFKTAIVEKEGDSGGGAGVFRLKLAERDVPKPAKRFDDDGVRIYDNKDAFDMRDNDEEDDGVWEGCFTDLIEPKLIQEAAERWGH